MNEQEYNTDKVFQERSGAHIIRFTKSNRTPRAGS